MRISNEKIDILIGYYNGLRRPNTTRIEKLCLDLKDARNQIKELQAELQEKCKTDTKQDKETKELVDNPNCIGCQAYLCETPWTVSPCFMCDENGSKYIARKEI